MTLNGKTLVQGSTYPLTLTISNPSEDHALNPSGANPDGSDSGFNTPNYEICFVAKQNAANADDASTSILLEDARFTPAADGQTATFSILPSDTSSITINGSKTYVYEAWVEDSTQPTVHSYSIESGSFTLKDSVKD